MLRLRSVLLPLGLSACLLAHNASAGRRHQPTDEGATVTTAGSFNRGAATVVSSAASGATLSMGTSAYGAATTLTTAGVNSYTGGATLSNATLNLSGLTLGSGGTLTLNGASFVTGQTVVFDGRTYTIVNGTGTPLVTPQAATPPYSQIIIFGDSLSDTGNVARVVDDKIGIRFPGPTLGGFDSDYDYTDGRFTNGTDTSPAAKKYEGVWHEQLATLFLGLKAANPSLDGGTDYAYGDAETGEGFRPITEGSGDQSVTIDIANLNKQVTTYLADNPAADPDALYIVWAGSNDLLDTDNPVTPATAASNETAVVQRLAEAGATTFLLPNVPPLGLVPDHAGDAALTQAAADFRDLYNADLDALQATLAAEGKTVTFHRLDIFDLYTRLISSGGAAYGFINISDPAQGEGVKADQFLSWDGLHPTTYGHFQIAAEAYTVLTGTPIVEVSQTDRHVNRNSGERGSFLLTRTGTDLSTELMVPYTLLGNAVGGEDYVTLKGQKKMKAGKQTVKIGLAPLPGDESAKVKLVIGEGTGYVLPVVKSGVINLDPDDED